MAVGSVAMPLTEAVRACRNYSRNTIAVFSLQPTASRAAWPTRRMLRRRFLRLTSGDLPITNAGSYLYRAAINGALDVLRRRKAAATEPLEHAAAMATTGPSSSPETVVSSKELGVWLRLAISELPPRAAEMFSLRYVEELGNREIATLMGTSQAVVAVTLHHARTKLKKRLREIEQGRP